MIKIMHDDGIGYNLYFEKNGRYYVTHFNHWKKGGYAIAGGTKRISEKEYKRVAESTKAGA